MGRRATLTNSLAKGVLDPRISERIDLPHYYSGLESALNIECFPQGGCRRRAGSTLAGGRLRRRIQPLHVTAGMISLANGGTAANLVDQSDETALVTNSVSGATFVLASIDLGAAQPIVFVDVREFSCGSGRFPRALTVEWYDGANWFALGPAGTARKTLTTDIRTRRFGEAPGIVRSARYWRLVAYDAAGAGAVAVGGVRFWTEKRSLSPGIDLSFERAADLVYQFDVSDRNIDVFSEGAYQASIATDLDARQLGQTMWAQSLDTGLLYNADVATQQIMRQGANDEWNGMAALFDNVPTLTPGTAFAGDQDEVQELRAPGLLPGHTVVFWLEGKVTAPVTYVPATWAADVKTALVAIGVPSGVSVTAIDPLDAGLRLWFLGTAGARRWPVVQAVVLDSDEIEPVTVVLQRGLDSDGAMWGDTTGWPRCGTLYQDRHLVAGFRAAPQSWQWSRFGDEFDFLDTGDPLTADVGVGGTLNTDRLETISAVFIGRNIQLFTETGEWYMEARTIDATQPPNVLLGTRNGIKLGVPPIFADGSTLIIQRGGRVVLDLTYSDVELSYKSEPLSLLGPHLLKNVVSVAMRPARSTDEGHQLWYVNDDGTIAFMALLKSQEVVAMAPWATDGHYRTMFADVRARAWQVVERRSLAHGADRYLERQDGTHTLDAAVIYDRGGATTQVVDGLDVHEGKEVWAWVDRDLVGPMLVTDGQVTLPIAASRAIVGLFPVVRARLPKLREKLQNGYPWRPPARIYELGLALAGTGQIDISVNGGPFRDVPLTFGAERALDIGAKPPRDTTGISTTSAADMLERLVRGLVMIPGSGEFVYATDVIEKTIDAEPGYLENMHNTAGDPDFLVATGQAIAALPNLTHMSLFVSWFGDDLRAGACTIAPRVDAAYDADVSRAPYDWEVAGLARDDATLVSEYEGGPAYGGTPADRSVVDAIQALKARSLAVTLSPFLVMDIAPGNSLPNPYGGASQPAYPWRGRITCTPAPGQPGTVDLTATAATQVAAFVGTAAAGDFTVDAEAGTVAYSGPAEWSYRRFILHYAHLALAAGGVDTFVIGSEMRGLTWVRSALGTYPFVTALVALAAEVKAVLGPDTKVVYAADWSEFVPHQTGVAGELFFHLDPLWASASVDAIGIDNYWPLADWRAGATHLDYVAGYRSIYDRNYLQGNIAGGEGFDWYYASGGDRTNQVRTPITDALGKPWVWRFKDIQSWWRNAHFNRPAGVESGAPTAWVPQGKPIWFMEAGCGAVDKGANQPNVFSDPKSSESVLPYFSSGVRDDQMQRAYLEALLSYYTPGQTGFVAENNPISTVTGKRMVEFDRIYAYCWDARFHPAFPRFLDVWADGGLWETGHWLTGRLFLSQDLNPNALPVGLGPDLPMMDRLITGEIRVTNLRGWSRHPTIEFSQRMPAPLELRAIRSEVATRG